MSKESNRISFQFTIPHFGAWHNEPIPYFEELTQHYEREYEAMKPFPKKSRVCLQGGSWEILDPRKVMGALHPSPLALSEMGWNSNISGQRPLYPSKLVFTRPPKCSSELLDCHFKLCWTMCKQATVQQQNLQQLKNNLQEW